jgi:hypothetical protein
MAIGSAILSDESITLPVLCRIETRLNFGLVPEKSREVDVYFKRFSWECDKTVSYIPDRMHPCV